MISAKLVMSSAVETSLILKSERFLDYARNDKQKAAPTLR